VTLAAPAARAKVEPTLQLSAEFPIDLANPEASVPDVAKRNAKPLEFGYYLQDLIALGDDAMKRGDHGAAAHFFRAFAMAVPDRSVAFSKLCEALEAGGQRQAAEQACRDALGRPGIELGDYARFVRLLLAKPGALAAADVEDIEQIVAHLRESPATRLSGAQLECEYAMHVDNLPLLDSCSRELMTAAPNDPKAVTFAWAVALRKGDREGAKRLIARAQALGIKPEGIRRMEAATAALRFGWRAWLAGWRGIAGAVVAVSAAALGALLIVRRRRVGWRQRFV